MHTNARSIIERFKESIGLNTPFRVELMLFESAFWSKSSIRLAVSLDYCDYFNEFSIFLRIFDSKRETILKEKDYIAGIDENSGKFMTTLDDKEIDGVLEFGPIQAWLELAGHSKVVLHVQIGTEQKEFLLNGIESYPPGIGRFHEK